MKWKKLPLGPLQTNGYVVYENGTGVMIDPGGDEGRLLNWLKSEDIHIQAVLLTHAHFDHIGAVERIKKEFSAPLYVHKNEQQWLVDPQLNGSGLFQGITPISVGEAEHLITKEGPLEVGPFTFQVYTTPGHSPGSVSYYLPESHVIFSGDVLFHGGVGRTDLPGGSQETLMDTIHNKFLSLPDETIVANGHGPVTTIGEEKEINPFINGFGW
ncbi:MBL fold metallo-hydrolase [Evansella cellulosilytica]|uniref:Beta-lactamase domain protein n=1 Tax=Evansella cellulosilytica (strain ATCC 21833 / DSM 2522 / FERM P-1141 / JCM 9156 / N-4) TaxID=649639 RepID=E6TWY2_EVAC2|nr:MBL fold metallo-hydrolase [Evansella cellulosilytica]ADU29932.1 beta-lactamase domain protein [Evansella cellulosilytica DSM 2522]